MRNNGFAIQDHEREEYAAYDACLKAFAPQFRGDRLQFDESDIRFQFMALWYRINALAGEKGQEALKHLEEAWQALPRREK
jgi:hypothetical protein